MMTSTTNGVTVTDVSQQSEITQHRRLDVAAAQHVHETQELNVQRFTVWWDCEL